MGGPGVDENFPKTNNFFLVVVHSNIFFRYHLPADNFFFMTASNIWAFLLLQTIFFQDCSSPLQKNGLFLGRNTYK